MVKVVVLESWLEVALKVDSVPCPDRVTPADDVKPYVDPETLLILQLVSDPRSFQ